MLILCQWIPFSLSYRTKHVITPPTCLSSWLVWRMRGGPEWSRPNGLERDPEKCKRGLGAEIDWTRWLEGLTSDDDLIEGGVMEGVG